MEHKKTNNPQKDEKKIKNYVKIITLIIFGGIIAQMFVSNDSKYWAEFLYANLLSVGLFIVCIFLTIFFTRKGIFKEQTRESLKFIGSLILGIIISLILFFNWSLPLDKDLPIMINKSYSETTGTLKYVYINRTRSSTTTHIIVKDNVNNEEINIKFLRQAINDLKDDDVVTIKYLPNSHIGISYIK